MAGLLKALGMLVLLLWALSACAPGQPPAWTVHDATELAPATIEVAYATVEGALALAEGMGFIVARPGDDEVTRLAQQICDGLAQEPPATGRGHVGALYRRPGVSGLGVWCIFEGPLTDEMLARLAVRLLPPGVWSVRSHEPLRRRAVFQAGEPITRKGRSA